MSDISTAFVFGFGVGSVLTVLLGCLLFCLKCRQCTKEHDHEVRIHDAE